MALEAFDSVSVVDFSKIKCAYFSMVTTLFLSLETWFLSVTAVDVYGYGRVVRVFARLIWVTLP